MIAAAKAGGDIYVQKPISVDVVEGQAMLAAARKYKRVVQVGTQRRSTPHLINAAIASSAKASSGTSGWSRSTATTTCGRRRTRRTRRRRRTSITRCGPAPRRCGRTTSWCIPRSWRAFMEYGNGIVGDMCVHMLDMVRWMLDLGCRTASVVRRHPGREGGQANITDTQTATFDFGDLPVVWPHRTYGDAAGSEVPVGRRRSTATRARSRPSVMGYDFIPPARAQPIHEDVKYELEEYPEDKTEKDLEKHVAPAIRGHMKNLLKCIQTRGEAGGRHRAGLHLGTACILANLSMKLGRR